MGTPLETVSKGVGSGFVESANMTLQFKIVHVTPPDAPSPVITQDDSWPAQGERATFTWIEGEVVADAHPLPGLPEGAYSVRVGLYDPDGVRLPIISDEDQVIDDALTLPIRLDLQTR